LTASFAAAGEGAVAGTAGASFFGGTAPFWFSVGWADDSDWRTKLGGKLMVVLEMPRLGTPAGRFSRYETGRTSLVVEGFTSAVPLAADCLFASGFAPGKICREGADIKTSPSLLSKREANTIWRSLPPTSSHGNQKLYECPNLDSL